MFGALHAESVRPEQKKRKENSYKLSIIQQQKIDNEML